MLRVENKFCLFILIILISQSCFAQFNFLRNNNIPVAVSGNNIRNPWAGGLNSPQFSPIDLNGDGIKDLFVFDREGHKVLTFINNGTADSVDYWYAPEYQSKFPEMKDWALLVDYNCDGKEDIYTSVSAGMAVYRNDYTVVGGLKFTLMTPLLYTEGFSGQVNLYVSLADIPAITDLDGDGDPDILTFGVIGTQVEYHQNLSMEDYGICDSLKYKKIMACWGNFAESPFDNSINLGVSCKAKTSGKSQLHSGSTLLALDMDGDNDKELVLGDISYPNLILLTNGGDSSYANMIAYDTAFPSNTIPVDLNIFPAAYYLDVNNDGRDDLLAAPNTITSPIDSVENFTSVWHYKDISISDTVVFVYQSNSFLQEEMIEVGSGANPIFFDANADGLLDIVIGNFGYYGGNGSCGNYTGELSLYRNIGTAANPSYELVTRDYASTSALNLNGLYPAFGDLDNDGDEDMIIGDCDGLLHYFDNTAGAGNPANFVFTIPGYMGIDVGQYAAPQLIDVNRDTLLDMIIGERLGSLNYYENVGTISSPAFTLISGTFGSVDVREQFFSTGYSTPFMLEDSSGEYVLLVGSESGYIYLYNNIEGNLTGTFTLVDSTVADIDPGWKSSISLADINNDSKVELIIGNSKGGVNLFSETDSIVVIVENEIEDFNITVYPNPNDGSFQIIIHNLKREMMNIMIMNSLGQLVYQASTKEADNNIIYNIDLGKFSYGLYYVRIRIGDSYFNKKIVIQ